MDGLDPGGLGRQHGWSSGRRRRPAFARFQVRAETLDDCREAAQRVELVDDDRERRAELAGTAASAWCCRSRWLMGSRSDWIVVHRAARAAG